MPGLVIRFDEDASKERAIVGGKGANLGWLSQAGFPVPPGFTVATQAYDAFVAAGDLAGTISGILSAIDYANAEDVEAKSTQIRALFSDRALPEAVAGAIAAAYRDLGDMPYVAVRSSGTAEDMAEASFAGQHDTYLDIRDDDGVLDAVKRCWASLWTSRAVAYRRQNGIGSDNVSMAVVVQTMIAPDVAGVAFTANPITGAVDEIVVNASWGLGESVVSGIVTPDQYVLLRDTLEVRSSVIANKTIRMVRNPNGKGTIEEAVPAADAHRPSLTAAELRALGQLARAVQASAEGMPQDIEWALAGGTLYLLQSRDITGITLSWDEDMDDFELCFPETPGTVWTRAWGDQIWPEATPLFYSIRAEMTTALHVQLARIWGHDDIAELRPFKYHRGHVYYNSKVDYETYARVLPRSYRSPEMLVNMPASWRKEIAQEDWSLLTPLKIIARIAMLRPGAGPYKVLDTVRDIMRDKTAQADGLSLEEMRLLSDRQLKRYVNSRLAAQSDWVANIWTSFFVYLPMALSMLGDMIQRWYDGKNPYLFTDLITGLDAPTITLVENEQLWEVAQRIKASPKLRALFDANADGAFFEAAAAVPEGAAFTTAYAAFLAEHGHRGHGDRDINARRRSEDPSIDYLALRALLTSDASSPSAGSEALIERRRAAADDFIASIRRHPPFAALKVEAFQVVHSWLLKFFEMRDNQRHYTDRITFSKKRALEEVDRRLKALGLLKDDDFYFLSKGELFELLDTRRTTPLFAAKIAGRRINYDRVRDGHRMPMYIVDGQYADLDAEPVAEGAQGGPLRGIGTSRGEVVGRARIVPTHKQIGEVVQGDILITAATDPGWTPVFLVISGLILETGGMLAHGSCISREYGIPAVQLTDAMRLIPDGALISVNGDTGEVKILAGPDEKIVGINEKAA